MRGKVHRVVVTGLGAVSPVGVGAKETYKGMIAGRMGIKKLENAEKFKSRIGGLIASEFDENKW